MQKKKKRNFLIDMDGVLVHGKNLIPGAESFIETLKKEKRKFLILTNNSLYTTRDLAHRLRNSGLNISESNIYTSALATASFLNWQKPNGTAFVIGELGLSEAIHSIGYIQTTENPDYVVLGETFAYNVEQITKAIQLIMAGAKFIATNPDPNGPSDKGISPATGAVAALIEKASGISPFFIGKPSAMMMRLALNYLDAHSEETFMVGDRMDTDILSGVSTGMDTILVLTGVTTPAMIDKFPYQPRYVFDLLADIVPSELD